MRALARDVVALRPAAVGLIGGEPFCFRGWDEIVATLRQGGVRVGMVSHGVGWTEARIARLQTLGVDQIALSLDGASPAVHDGRRGHPGAFAEVRELVDRLTEPPVVFPTRMLITTVFADNLADLGPLFALLEEVAPGWLWQIHAGSPVDGGPPALTRSQWEQLRTQIHTFARHGRRLAGIVHGHEMGFLDPHTLDDWQGCPAGRTNWAITSDGKVIPCLALDRRLARDRAGRSLAQLWRDDSMFGWWRVAPDQRTTGACRSCRWALLCQGGCPEVSLAFGRTIGNAVYCCHRPDDADGVVTGAGDDSRNLPSDAVSSNSARQTTYREVSMKAQRDPLPAILEAFARISAIPRRSKNETAIGQFLQEWAGWHGFPVRRDDVGNLVINVPATPGCEKAPTVILQGHMDMVCEKTPDSPHDFTRDPIKLITEGEWLHADRTTLGADNGIALAMAMVVAESAKVKRPPLELLFTVDEENGLTGALNLKPGFFTGRLLLNLDSEDEGVFTIGCAGGRDTHIDLPVQYESVPAGYRAFRLHASGMSGGHSGVNIHEERANAIRVLVRALAALAAVTDLRVVGLAGGTAHNAIPRDAEAVCFLPGRDAALAQDVATHFAAAVRAEFQRTDPHLALALSAFDQVADDRAMTEACTRQALDLVFALPHGVTARSTDEPTLVETSNNLATVGIDAGFLRICTSQRSLVMSRLDAITAKIEAVARLAGAAYRSSGGYPSWKPNFDSALLATSKEVYQKLFKKAAKVEVIHAGLECGIIGDIVEGMQMVSFGATLKDPHSPRERLHLPSVTQVWKFLVALLDRLATNPVV